MLWRCSILRSSRSGRSRARGSEAGTTSKGVLTNSPDFPKTEVKRVVGAEDKWVLGPTWTPLQVIGTGDDYTIESYINYPNGERWHSVAIVQFRNGKVHWLTEYFAAPFPPAEWRAPWAEKIESSS